MIKIFVFYLILLISTSNALELTYGKGNFDYKFSLNGIIDASVDMDVNVLSLREHHFGISDNIYIFGNLDIYNSDTLDSYTSYINKAADYHPFGFPSASDIASGMGAPVPVSFKMRGIDMSIGIGYDVYKDDKGSIGVGFATGVSMPYIETENMIDNAELFMAILEKTKTEIMTYKLMPSINAHYQIIPMLSFEASLSYGYQFGSISNDYISSDASFKGNVMHSDIALKLTPFESSKVCFDMGYRYNNWDVESMDVTILNKDFSYDFSQNFDIGFDSSFFYIGAGYNFSLL
jgi:hypothetical protein